MKNYDTWEKRSPEVADLLNRVQQEVQAIVPEADIILYGSRARGEAGPVSDWDFLILTDQPLNKDTVRKIKDRLYDLELDTNTVISSIIRTREEWYSQKYKVVWVVKTKNELL